MANAEGRGSAVAQLWMVVCVVVAVHCSSRLLLASAATLTVGDSQGWTYGYNYTAWAANHSFALGDILFFPYTKDEHTVAVVNKKRYDACSASNAAVLYTDGNTSVTLNTSGAHYFLCSIPTHCTQGNMKLAVTVGAGAAPVPGPSAGVGAMGPATGASPSSPPSSLAAVFLCLCAAVFAL